MSEEGDVGEPGRPRSVGRRAWRVGLLAVAVLAAGGGAVAVHELRRGTPCGDGVVSLPASRSSSPFLGAADRARQPDARRDRLVARLEADGAPVGRVLGAVGYDYDQWAQLSAYAQGLGVRTRDNPGFTMLDDRTLRPRWSVRVQAGRSAYDADARSYLVATLPADRAPELVLLDADTGRRRWCTSVGDVAVTGTRPFATQLLPDGSVVVLTPAPGARERVTRLTAGHGTVRWSRTLDADAGDFLGSAGAHGLLVGGRGADQLLEDSSLRSRRSGNGVAMLDDRDGSTTWTLPTSRAQDVHVIGVDASGSAYLQARRAGEQSERMVGVDPDGTPRWTISPTRDEAYDVTLRGTRLLVRDTAGFAAYATSGGRRLWTRTLPGRPQQLPYGFSLDAQPSLDADHLLLGATTALRTLDVRDGSTTDAALPTDGISTTYWPYQVVLTDRLLAVATNTGAVVARRE
ncbi:MAG: hypothetical protein JWR42_762 [Marmoricola sp.]|nr:hypothetical protein [Marmoricola sp.]